MEYERALYRVHERCMESLSARAGGQQHHQNTNKGCLICERFTLVCFLFFLTILVYLHLAFVNQAGCLPEQLNLYASKYENDTNFDFKPDQLLFINVAEKFSSRNVKGGSGTWSNNWQRKLRLTQRSVRSNSPEDTFQLDNFTDPDFQYANSWSILSLPKDIRMGHRFEVINVTMDGTKCFGNAITQFLIPFGGVDTVIMNSIMFSIPRDGILQTRTGDAYTWSKTDISRRDSNASSWLSFRISIIVLCAWSFFFLSTTTALLVRILISSGVVIFFPFFWFLQRCGVAIFNNQIISLSYPWLGIPLEMYRLRNQSSMPFLIAHITRVLIFYFMYEASQMAMSIWFYGETIPSQRELWLFTIMMIMEYYSMIYIRSKMSIQTFPRVFFLLYLLYHIYFYAYPSGFHVLAIFTMFLLLLWLMIFCVRKFEHPAYERGEVSLDQPRALYNSLPWFSWVVALAPDFTLFMPVNNRSVSAYADVPNNYSNLPFEVPFVNSQTGRGDIIRYELNGTEAEENIPPAASDNARERWFIRNNMNAQNGLYSRLHNIEYSIRSVGSEDVEVCSDDEEKQERIVETA